MFFSFLLFVLFVLSSVLSSPAAIPRHIHCESGDDACLTKAAQAVFSQMLEPNPEIGTEEMDPMYQEIIEANLPILKLKLFNTTITGFKTCKVVKAAYNETADSEKIELFCNKFTLKGQYDISGRLIVIPVEGNGNYLLETGEYKIIVDLLLKTLTKDGMIFRTIKSFTTEAEALTPVKFDFQGLFNDQKELADEVLKYAHENWKLVADVLSLPVLNPNLRKIVQNTNKYLKTRAVRS